MALDYGNVKDMYDTLYDAGVTTKTLPEWSQDMNELTGTDLYAAGLHDNWIKRTSHGIDKILESTGLPGYSEQFGRQVGGLVGAPEEGAEVGRGLPRATLNFAPLLIPGGGWLGAAAKFGATAALTGAETYTRTDSPLAGLISGATAASLPAIASRVGAAVSQPLARAVGGKLVEGPLEYGAGKVAQVSQYFPQTLGQRIAVRTGSELAGQAAAAGAMGVTQPLEQLAAGEEPSSPFTTANLLGLTLGQAPFAAIHLARGAISPAKSPVLRAQELEKAIALSRARIALKDASKDIDAKTGVEKIPDVVEKPEDVKPTTTKDIALLHSQVRGEQLKISEDPTLTDDQKLTRENELMQRDYDLSRQKELEAGLGILGDTIRAEDPRTEVFGTELYRNRAGTFRRIHVADDPLNPPELRGKTVGYSTLNEPAPYQERGGVTRYSLPPRQHYTPVELAEWQAKYGRRIPVAEQTPELPQRAEPITEEELQAQLHDLESVHAQVDAADTPAEVQQAVVGVNEIEHRNDLPPTNDARLAPNVEQLQDAGVKPNDALKGAVKSQATKTARKTKSNAKSLREQQRAAPPLTPEQAAEITASMEGGFSVITADKLSKGTEESSVETQPLKDLTTEAAIESAKSPEALDMYNNWEGREDTTYAKDFRDFLDLIGVYGSLSRVPPEAGKMLAERGGGGTIPWDAAEVQEFINRPHVQEWQRGLDEGLADAQRANMAPIPNRIVRPAGNRFLFAMAPYDPVTNRLGGKHTLPRDSVISIDTFQKIGGIGKPLNKAEIELYKQIVPEAFGQHGKVDVSQLDAGLKSSGPVVETKTLGGPQRVEAVSNVGRANQHQLETMGYELQEREGHLELFRNGRVVRFEEMSPEVRDFYNNIVEAGFDEVGAGAQYDFIGPKPPEQMPGYVEGLVRLPSGLKYVEGEPTYRPSGVVHRGPHFGAEDKNVLSFYRGYEETLPNGEKAFHVIEVQSDWGQKQREFTKERQARLDKIKISPPIAGDEHWSVSTPEGTLLDYDTEEKAKVSAEKIRQREFEARPEVSHPLLNVYNELALKAAIQHAKDIGATKVIVSDAETAMMTEGHDRTGATVRGESGAVVFQGSVDTARKYVEQHPNLTLTIEGPTQEKGMRLNYDQILPRAMEKLTGGKGQGVDLGVHKAAIDRSVTPELFNKLDDLKDLWDRGEITDEQYRQRANELRSEFELREGVKIGSPVFKDAQGQPKENVTGRMYDISNVPEELTLTEPTRAPGTVARGFEPPWVPQEQRDVDTMNQMGLTEGGVGMNRYLSQSKNPLFQAIAADLAKFGDSLARVSGSIRDFENGAYAARLVGGKYDLRFAPAILRADDFTREFAVAHELVHGISLAELEKPTNFQLFNGLDALRRRVADKLPTAMKNAYYDAITSGWYEQWGRNRRTFESLMPNGTPAQRETLYGLIDTREFVSQGITSPALRQYLQSVKFKGESWFSRFSNFIKTLTGIGERVSNTAFEEFLSRTDQLLDRGNFVSSFKNFSDRYFENFGQSQQVVNSNTQRAMAIVLNEARTADEALMLLRQGAGAFRTPEWGKAQSDVFNMFKEGGQDALDTQGVLAETGNRTDHNGLLDMADSLMLGEEGLDALHVLPERAARYIFETVKDAQNIFGVLRAAAHERNEGLLNLAKPKVVGQMARETMQGIDRVMEANRLHDMQVRDIQGLFQMVPNSYMDNVVRAPEIIPPEFTNEKEPQTRDMISRFLEPTAQIAKSIPESAEAIDRGFQLRSNVRHMARESLKALGMDLALGRLTPKTVKDMFRMFANPKLRRAADSWIAENNIRAKRDEKGVEVIDVDDPTIQKILGDLKPADRDIVEDMVNKHSISTQHMQEQILEKVKQISSTNAGAMVMKLTGYKLKDSVDLAGRLLDAYTADRTDPNAAAAADGQIQLIQSKLTSEQYLALARFTKQAADKWQGYRTEFKNNPGWSTAQRQGKYLVEFKGKLLQADSKKEAVALTGDPSPKMKPNRQYDEDRPPSLGFDAPGVAERLRQYDQNMLDILKNTGTFSPEQIETIKPYLPGEQFITEETYRGGVPGLQPQPRRLGKGAEELPWLRNHVSWVHQTANYWSRQLLRAQARAHLSDPEITANEQLRNDLQTHFENMLQPDTQFGNFFRRLAMTWFMGFNPASAMVNATQPFVTHVAELTAMTGKPLQSYRRTISALKEVYASGLGHGEWKDPTTAEFMKRFIKDGEADQSMFDDEAAGNELLHTNLVRMLNGDKPQTLGQKLSTLSGNLSNSSMILFRTVERINSMAAGISGYKYYLEKGLSPDQAYTEAVRFHHAVNYGGGAAARPIGAFAGRGAFPRTVAMLSTAMQSYNLGSAFQIARYIRQGFFRPNGLTPAEVHNARTAALQVLSTQLAAAGVLGLPFVSGMLSVLNQAFPQLELNRKLRENMNALLGGDDDNGSVLSDIAMTGVPSMTGWDLQSRLSMGNTLPGVSEINGFEPQNLLGAPVNLVSNFIRGGYKLAAGDIHGVDDFVPSALKKFEQLLRSGGQVLDYRNRPIFTPTLGEKVGIALGFNPKRLTDFNAASRIARQADDNIKRREGEFHQQMAEEVLRGNFGSVRQALVQRLRENSKYDPRAAVRAISGAAEELTFPRDLRREGTTAGSDIRGRLLASFSIPPSGPSEVDRLKFRQGIAQRLGIIAASPTGLQTATLMDELRRQQPEASRSELRRQSTLLLRGRRPEIFPLQAE